MLPLPPALLVLSPCHMPCCGGAVDVPLSLTLPVVMMICHCTRQCVSLQSCTESGWGMDCQDSKQARATAPRTARPCIMTPQGTIPRLVGADVGTFFSISKASNEVFFFPAPRRGKFARNQMRNFALSLTKAAGTRAPVRTERAACDTPAVPPVAATAAAPATAPFPAAHLPSPQAPTPAVSQA